MNWPWTKLEQPYSLPLKYFGRNTEAFTWEDWHRETKSKYPIRYFFQETARDWFVQWFVMLPSTMWYWFESHTYRRRHMLDLRDKRLEYSYGWIDKSSSILIASFKLLEEFVHEEMSPGHVDWEADVSHSKVAAEVNSLYYWWTVERPAEWKTWEKTYSVEEENRLSKKDNEQLKRLADVREYLWT